MMFFSSSVYFFTTNLYALRFIKDRVILDNLISQTIIEINYIKIMRFIL